MAPRRGTRHKQGYKPHFHFFLFCFYSILPYYFLETQMKIEDLKKDIEKGDMIYRGRCHDCSKQVEVTATLRKDGSIHIDGNGSVYKVKIGLDAGYFFKCNTCFKKDKILRNWEICEVYSRVVGYLRPVSQWNKGKKAEYGMRKVFKKTM